MQIFKYLNPHNFNNIAVKIMPILWLLTGIFFALGIYYALVNSPVDYQQQEMVRVMYVHVPAAWMALGIYCFIAACSLSSFVWKTRMSYIMAVASAPIGASFAMITLVTGSIWGKPIWGTWWVWDARLTSMLILFLLYLSYIAVVSSGDNIMRGEKPATVIALIGFINIPIIKFSVDIWYSLHQPASILRSGGSAIHKSMLAPLFLMFAAFIFYFIAVLLLRTKTILTIIKNDSRSN